MWKTGPPTSKDLPEVLQWGDGASRGPEAGSGLEGRAPDGKTRERTGESGTRTLAWIGGGTGTRTSRIGWARLRRPLAGLFIGGISPPGNLNVSWSRFRPRQVVAIYTVEREGWKNSVNHSPNLCRRRVSPTASGRAFPLLRRRISLGGAQGWAHISRLPLAPSSLRPPGSFLTHTYTKPEKTKPVVSLPKRTFKHR